MDKLIIEGYDNYGKPRQNFADSIALLEDNYLKTQMETIIWLSAYVSNNKRSDYHWQAQACYNECKRRNNISLYEQAYDRALKTL